jgi:tripartite-type tricarboxylate transporter receptor subunit TctC
MKRFRAGFVLGVLLPLAGPASAAEEFPTRAIEFVTQSSPGGGGDVVARQLIEAAKDQFSQPMVVVNKPGAGGRNLENYVKDAKPDGHTLIVTTATNVLWLFTGSLTTSINTDWRPVIRLQVEHSLVAVKASAPWKNMSELLADAKAGKVTFGGGPIGSFAHLFGVKLAKDNGFKLNYVAYGGGGETGTGLLGGNIDVSLMQDAEVADHVKAGTLRLLGVASAERATQVAELKDVPTLREQGVDLVLEHWRGIHTHAAAPDAAVEYLHTRFKQALNKDSWKKWLQDTGQLGGYLAPADFKKFTLEQEKVFEALATEAGMNKRSK